MRPEVLEHTPQAQSAARANPLHVTVALALVLACAGFLRLNGLDREGRWGDEYQQTRSYDLPITYPHYVALAARQAGQPPGDYLIGWLLAKVHRSDWMRRAPAAFFGIFGVALCFALTRRLFSPSEGLVAACLVAAAPLHWALSREARPYAIAMAAMLVMLIAVERALSQPTRRPLILYAVAAYLFTLTRSVMSLVVLLSIGIVLSLLWIRLSREVRRSSEHTWSHGAIRRVWFTTLLVGLAAVPMVAFLLNGDGSNYTALSSEGRALGAAIGQPVLARFAANLTIWAQMPRDMFGDGYPIVMAFTVLGMVQLWRERRTAVPTRNFVLSAMLISGPLYLFIYSAAVTFHPIQTRYAMFLTPLLAILASVGFMAFVRWFRQLAPANARLQTIATTVALAVLLVSPVHKTLGLCNHFFRPDWRGCAAYLEAKVSPRDVVVVFQDRPLGRPQATFWGKYEWATAKGRPLAEPVWSLVASQPHWERLVEKDGKVFIVIRHEVQPGPENAYLATGLDEAPRGSTLKKFRGLDLLTLRTPADLAVERKIQACDVLLSIPKENPDSNAMLLALRSRLELLAGRFPAAVESFGRAQALVPQRLSTWFATYMATYIDTLNRAGVAVASAQ